MSLRGTSKRRVVSPTKVRVFPWGVSSQFQNPNCPSVFEAMDLKGKSSPSVLSYFCILLALVSALNHILKAISWSWRDDSSVKSDYCSWKEPDFSSQDACGSSHLLVTVVPGIQHGIWSPRTPAWIWCPWACSGPHIHTLTHTHIKTLKSILYIECPLLKLLTTLFF